MKEETQVLPVQVSHTLVHLCGLCLLSNDPADDQEDHEVNLRIMKHTEDTKLWWETIMHIILNKICI